MTFTSLWNKSVLLLTSYDKILVLVPINSISFLLVKSNDPVAKEVTTAFIFRRLKLLSINGWLLSERPVP